MFRVDLHLLRRAPWWLLLRRIERSCVRWMRGASEAQEGAKYQGLSEVHNADGEDGRVQSHDVRRLQIAHLLGLYGRLRDEWALL
jgi:hypothetical protein